MKIIPAKTTKDIGEVRCLFREYAAFLNVDLCFQSFEEELAGLLGKYAPYEGALLIAVDDGCVAGCVALRKLECNVCEMKRLFVRPQYQGRGIGRKLAESIIERALDMGYSLMRLDTLNRLGEAVRLYESLNFRQCEAYYKNPLPGVMYWELKLTGKKC